MSHKLEETFETLLGSPRRKPSAEPTFVEATGSLVPEPEVPEGDAVIVPDVEPRARTTGPDGNSNIGDLDIGSDPSPPAHYIPCTGGTEISVEVEPAPSGAAPDLERVEIPCDETLPDCDDSFARVVVPRRKDSAAVDEGEDDTNLDSDLERRVVTMSKGSYLVPNYVSDYLLKNLSLAEQSVFNRLYRVSAGFWRKSDPLTIGDLAESCGLNAKFTATVIKSLVSKKLVKVIWGNPLSRKVRFKLILPREVEKRIVLCGVCHDLIHEEEEWEYYPIARTLGDRVQTIVAHVRCVPGEPLDTDG